jgi:hypothetical protein
VREGEWAKISYLSSVRAVTVGHEHGIGETKRRKSGHGNDYKEEPPEGERMDAD